MNLDTVRNKLRSQMPDVLADLRSKVDDHMEERPRREAGYSIQNAAGDEAIVRIYDEIWWLGVNALDLASDLDAITAPEIRVEINSPGGDVFDGIAIYNALRTHPAKITTRVDGIAASIASVIAQAGDHRIMVQSSQMMIHNAWGMTVGNRNDHADMAGLLGQQDDIIAGIYAARSGKPAEGFKTLMDAETWLSDERAVAEGLADEILVPTAPQDRAPTLHDEISAAVDAVAVAISSAERVDALRADAGKTLSTVNRESLAGLRDTIAKIDDLLIDDSELDPEIEAKRLAAAMKSIDFAASLPPHLI